MSDYISSRRETVPALTGWSGSKEYFRFVKEVGKGVSDLASVVRVLRGDVLGVIYKNMVSGDVREEIARRIQSSPDLQGRGADAPGRYIGTVHYARTTTEYLEAAPGAAMAVDAVVGGPRNPLQRFWEQLDTTLRKSGAGHRLAAHRGRSACAGLIRSLPASSDYALSPHEDLSQCQDPRQAGFEIQHVVDFQVAALNICVESGRGGRLVIWNIKPDLASKRALGTLYSGVPYPLCMLERIDRLTVDVEAGDAYVFNSGHLHAVEPILGPGSRRTAIAAILGFVDPTTVVSWT